MKLALDAMGGDNAPQINVDGATLALAQLPNLEKIYMVGDGDTVKAACEGLNLAEICIVSQVDWAQPEEGAEVAQGVNFADLTIGVSEAKGEKCPRCWMHSLDANAEGLCPRCAGVVSKLEIEL